MGDPPTDPTDPTDPTHPSGPQGRASRGGDKLAAALDAFALGPRLQGARCLDVGASHGGFTEELLARGAAHVTALDVGHDQLRPHLRTDPRVTCLEGVDFKRAPPRVAPGPFAFFAVDVSFVAGRSMLRGLCMRAAPGAEGVLLLKPNFELPTHLVPPGGVVTNQGHVDLAFTRFRAKADALGVAILARIDSPLRGGDGSREQLLHLRIDHPLAVGGGGER